MKITPNSYFGERAGFLGRAKPIWDEICGALDELSARPDTDAEGYISPEFQGGVYDWEIYVAEFDGTLPYGFGKDIAIEQPTEYPILVSPWGHNITSGYTVELWFTAQGGRRPPDDETSFVDEPKVIVICSREGVYDGHTHKLLDLDELEKFKIDIDRLTGRLPS